MAMKSRKESSSPKGGGVPWAKVVNTGPSSSSAPGPPSSYLLNRPSPSQSEKKSKASLSDREAEPALVQSSLEGITEAARK